MDSLITVAKLEKHFGSRWAVRNISFQIGQGEIVALVGPNGAGKTTLLRIIAALARPSAGQVHIGKIPLAQHAQAARAVIGFVGHQTFLYDYLTVEENLRLYARLYDIPHSAARVRAVAARVGIEEKLNEVTRTLSRGWQQRLTLARMLLHEPVVLLLDEPYTGLDQSAADKLDDIIGEAKREGRAVLFSTHDLERGLGVADRALVMQRGRIALDLKRAEWKTPAGFMELYAHASSDGSHSTTKPGIGAPQAGEGN